MNQVKEPKSKSYWEKQFTSPTLSPMKSCPSPFPSCGYKSSNSALQALQLSWPQCHQVLRCLSGYQTWGWQFVKEKQTNKNNELITKYIHFYWYLQFIRGIKWCFAINSTCFLPFFLSGSTSGISRLFEEVIEHFANKQVWFTVILKAVAELSRIL